MRMSKLIAEGMDIAPATPLKARRTKRTILLEMKPAMSEKIPSAPTPPMNAYSVRMVSKVIFAHNR